MNARFHHQAHALFVLCLLVLGGMCVFPSTASAQTAPTPVFDPNQTSGQADFLVYECQFQPQTNTVTLNAALAGADARSMPPGTYTMAISEVGTGLTIPLDHVQIAPITTRPPLQMILVVDRTDT